MSDDRQSGDWCGWMRTTVRWLPALLLVLWMAPAPANAAAERPDLSGTWQLDTDLSDDPMEAIRQTMESNRSRMSGGFGRGGGMGGGMGRGGGMGGGRPSSGGRGGGDDAQSREAMRSRMESLRKSLERMEIAQTPESISITYGDDRVVTFPTDGKKTEVAGRLGPAEVKASWKKSALNVRTESEGRKTTETYKITGDRKLLRVTVRMELGGPMGTIEYTRLYRPAETPAGEQPEVESETEADSPAPAGSGPARGAARP